MKNDKLESKWYDNKKTTLRFQHYILFTSNNNYNHIDNIIFRIYTYIKSHKKYN